MHDYVWTCRCCGKQQRGLPLDFAVQVPDPWLDIPEAERASHGKIDTDLCMIDRQHFFVRGCIELPLIGHDDVFAWGVWVSVSRESFDRILDLWDAQDVEREPPRFGWLCNQIRTYPPTYNLKTNLHLRSGGKRPAIELEPTDHPLALEQRNGITLERVEEIAAALLHRH